MENEDVIRKEMEGTRTAMTEKLEALEKKVVDTVETTTSAVTDSVEAVKDTVQETTAAVTDTVSQVKESVAETVTTVTDSVKGGLTSVRDFFSIRKNPWVGVGSSVLAGFVVGKVLFPARRDPIQGLASAGGPTITSAPPSAAAAAPAARPHVTSKNGGSHRERSQGQSKGWLEGIAGQLTPELNKFKGMALGMLLDASRDFIMQGVPQQWKEQVAGVFHGLASKLHATPESLETAGESSAPQGDEAREHRSDMERSGHRQSRRGQFDR